jgi:outer membrane lipoprotein-sorting protein
MVKKERALGWVFRVARPAAAFVALSAVLGAPAASRAGSADAALQNKIRSVYASVKSYRLTVLGSVRSTGDFVAPNKYEMTTDLDGKPVKTIIIGTTYWIYDQGKWEKSGDTGSSLDADIAGVIRRLKLGTASNFVRLPDQMRNGKRTGAFRVSFGGSNEVCDFDLQTYYVTRCQRDELTSVERERGHHAHSRFERRFVDVEFPVMVRESRCARRAAEDENTPARVRRRTRSLRPPCADRTRRRARRPAFVRRGRVRSPFAPRRSK